MTSLEIFLSICLRQSGSCLILLIRWVLNATSKNYMYLTKDNALLTTNLDNSQRSKGLFLKVLIIYTINPFFYHQYCKCSGKEQLTF